MGRLSLPCTRLLPHPSLLCRGGRQGPMSWGQRDPHLMGVAVKGTENQGRFAWHFHIPPGFRVGRRSDEREAPAVWGGCGPGWNSFQLSRASDTVMKIASCRAAASTSKDSFPAQAAPRGFSAAGLCILPTRPHVGLQTRPRKRTHSLKQKGQGSFAPEGLAAGAVLLLDLGTGGCCLHL